jgi:hypothetical protein
MSERDLTHSQPRRYHRNGKSLDTCSCRCPYIDLLVQVIDRAGPMLVLGHTIRIATGYRLPYRVVGVRVLLRSRIFTFLCRPGWHWGSNSFLSNGQEGVFSPGEGKLAGLTTHLQLLRYVRNRPWRPIGMGDVEDPTLSRQSAQWWSYGVPKVQPLNTAWVKCTPLLQPRFSMYVFM